MRKSLPLVGVTGHRPNRLPLRAWPRVAAQLDRVLAGFERGVPARRCTLMSGLAEGADRLAAEVALGRGWRLEAVLPFHRSRYEDDFESAQARGVFRALMSASSAYIEPARRWHTGRPAEDGYERQGEAILARASALIAIWDGKGAAGRGGTVGVIEDALRRGIPVIWIHASENLPPRRLRKSSLVAG